MSSSEKKLRYTFDVNQSQQRLTELLISVNMAFIAFCCCPVDSGNMIMDGKSFLIERDFYGKGNCRECIANAHIYIWTKAISFSAQPNSIRVFVLCNP